jgi:iron-sulfur cluster assembly accessory protein
MESTDPQTPTPKSPPEGADKLVGFTAGAVEKVREAMAQEGSAPKGLRVAVVGGGCAGFQYTLDFEHEPRPGDFVWEEDGFQVFVDKMSSMYLMGVQIDYVTSVLGAGFKFQNPNTTTTCGCGSSFA